jgi:ABC-type spermidine/putrescine transport system permease subunit II
LSKILELVQDATSQKAPTELFIRKFSKVYTPIVVYLSIAITLLPALFVDNYVFSEWLYRALVFLVISCPCALVISIPLGYFGGIGAASRNGILFKGSNFLFALVLISMITPSILVSLGVGLMFDRLGFSPEWYSSALGAQLTWSLPFGVLVMFVVFNRFNRNLEAASFDMGATSWQTVRWVVLPSIFPSVIGIAMTSFTLSYDEFARTLMTSGSHNTLPLEIYGMTTNATTPALYALGTVTTLFSFILISFTMCLLIVIAKRRARREHA